MKESRYNIFVRTSQNIYAVNLLSRTALNLTPVAYRFFRKIGSQGLLTNPNTEETALLSELREGLFLIEDEFDELSYIRYRYQEGRFNQELFGLVITPTLGCNFQCHYCFENKTDFVFSSESQNRLLHIVASNLPKYHTLNVQWFGGEPLLALDVVRTLSKSFLIMSKRMHCNYSSTVITNGVLLTSTVSRELKEIGVTKIQITLEGMRALHDSIRFSESGVGSFDIILSNLKKASKYFQISVRVHVTPYSVHSVHALLDYLDKMGLQPSIAELYFAPLFNYKVGMSEIPFVPNKNCFMTAADFASIQTELLDHAVRCGFKISDFLNSSYGLCTAVGANTLVIGADGHLFKCYLDVADATEAIGDLINGPQQKHRALKWLDYEFWGDAECRDCRLLPLCLGGCPKQRMLGVSKEVICTPQRFNIEDRIRLYFEAPVASTANLCEFNRFSS